VEPIARLADDYPLRRVVCHHRDAATGPRRQRPVLRDGRRVPVIDGSFAPPRGTLQLGIGRQPDGFTCGPETFLGICEFLRLPLARSNDDDINSYDKLLHTTYRNGTDPEDIVRVARDYLGIDAHLRDGLAVDELASLTNAAQPYVEQLLAGKAPDRPLSIAMVTYQAYVDPSHEKRAFYPKGVRSEEPQRMLKIFRDDGSVAWENDWYDGHWSAVLRVVPPSESAVLGELRAQLQGRTRAADVADGVVILGDPSNGVGLSFVPIPEFVARWHDTDVDSVPRFRQTAVVLEVPVAMLKRLAAWSRAHGLPMFSTVHHNCVLYVP
jgi:hypothetical protein